MNSKIDWKNLIISLAVTLGVGMLSGLATMNSMLLYDDLDKPLLAPPGWLFPIVWTVLYILMGISAYLVYMAKAPESSRVAALKVYALQLVVNALWTIIFFNLQRYLAAFIWLIFLWALIIIMIVLFARARRLAAYLQIPYLLWTTFAGYLTLGIYLMNR